MDMVRQASYRNCPTNRNPDTLVCTIDPIISVSSGEMREPDLHQLGPLPTPEGPAVHCLKAIRQLTVLVRTLDVASTNHRGVAYAALGTNDVIGKLRYLAVYVDTDEDIPSIGAESDRIAASILSGEPMDEDRKFAPPGEDDECVIKQELTTPPARRPTAACRLTRRKTGTLTTSARPSLPALPHEVAGARDGHGPDDPAAGPSAAKRVGRRAVHAAHGHEIGKVNEPATPGESQQGEIH